MVKRRTWTRFSSSIGNIFDEEDKQEKTMENQFKKTNVRSDLIRVSIRIKFMVSS